MHLTLAFLGEVSRDFLESATARLKDVAQQHRPFTVRLNGLGAFPSARRARVVWVGIDQGCTEVSSLQVDVVRSLQAVGYEPERRPFSPHLTIGRLRVPSDVQASIAPEFVSPPFAVSRLVLFKSVLQPAGPAYTVLADFPLAWEQVQPA
jgi:2'-5' RNA ligase